MRLVPSIAADQADERKSRGAFFTPSKLASFLAEWAVRAPGEVVLEPSCGEAAILTAVAERGQELGGTPLELCGFDIHSESLEKARRTLADVGAHAELHVKNFFDVPADQRFDAVVGNPPYVRYQSIGEQERIKAQRVALAQGVRLSNQANAWAAFVVHAAAFLKPNGRLALVLPAALLTVNYAASVRLFLLRRFRKVRLVMFEERVFPNVTEEVLLLLAEGPRLLESAAPPQFDVFQVHDIAELPAIAGLPDKSKRTWSPEAATDKWMHALVDAAATNAYELVARSPGFTDLSTWGETDLGAVTGNNLFFTLTRGDVATLELREDEVTRISPPGSQHLRGLTFSKKAFEEMAEEGARVYLFRPDPERLSQGSLRYIEGGERRRVHKAYKCEVRKHWFVVPPVRVPDLFLTYMNHDAPRLVSNGAKVAHLNSVHGVTLNRGLKKLGEELLPLAMLNSATLLGAELVGRSYGGGILKIEPKEADHLPLPTRVTLERVAVPLRVLQQQVGKELRAGRLDEIVQLVDRIVLGEALELSDITIGTLRSARASLVSRRLARGGRSA
ncbi:MAG: N-6 DNA methylase [Polyangiales bacterium]